MGEYHSAAQIPGTVKKQAVSIACFIIDDMLYETVREQRAWTYSIDACYYDFRHLYEFAVECDSLAREALDKIEGVVEDSINSVASREDLFNAAKQRILAESRMIDPTCKKVCKKAFRDLAWHQRIITLAEHQRDIETVTMDDMY